MALLDFFLYFITTQLVTAYWRLHPTQGNASPMVEAAILGSTEALENLLYRAARAPYQLTTGMKIVIKARGVAEGLDSERGGKWSPRMPLWGNPHPPHLQALPNPQIWAAKGIKILTHIISQNTLATF